MPIHPVATYITLIIMLHLKLLWRGTTLTLGDSLTSIKISIYLLVISLGKNFEYVALYNQIK